MAEIVRITNYDAEIFPLMMQQYQNSPNFKSIISMEDAQANNLELALWEIHDNYYLMYQGLPSAQGAQLDVIGKIFGVYRQGATDSVFLTQIQIRAASQLSGTINDILFTAISIFGSSPTGTFYTPNYPAGFALMTTVYIPVAAIQAMAPAGVGVWEQGFLIDQNGNPIVQQDGTSKILISVVEV